MGLNVFTRFMTEPLYENNELILKTIEDTIRHYDKNFTMPAYLSQTPGAITVGSIPVDEPQCSKNVSSINFTCTSGCGEISAAEMRSKIRDAVSAELKKFQNWTGIDVGSCDSKSADDTPESPFHHVNVTHDDVTGSYHYTMDVRASAGLNAAGLGQIVSNVLVQANSKDKKAGPSLLGGIPVTVNDPLSAFGTDGDFSGVQTCDAAAREKYDAYHGCGPTAVLGSDDDSVVDDWWFWVLVGAAACCVGVSITLVVRKYVARKGAYLAMS